MSSSARSTAWPRWNNATSWRLVSSIAATNFMQQAEGQAYRPTYIDNDLAFATTDTAASTKPASQFDGTSSERPAVMHKAAMCRRSWW